MNLIEGLIRVWVLIYHIPDHGSLDQNGIMAKGSRRYPISTVANENFMYIFGNCIGCIVQAGVVQRAPLEAEGGYLNVPP